MTVAGKYELKPWEEVIGMLNKLYANEERVTLLLSSFIRLEIPSQLLNKKIMKKALGHKVGVLRTDSGYCVRIFQDA